MGKTRLVTVEEPTEGDELGRVEPRSASVPESVAVPPQAGKLAAVGKLVAGGVSAIPVPFVGGVLGTAFEMMVDRGLNKRRDVWERTVVEAINRLAQWNKGFADSEVLMTAAVKAGRIALATHQQEKLDALRNAVVNSVASEAPDDDSRLASFD